MDIETPKYGYAFRHKQTGKAVLAVSLGVWDSIDNYEEITEEEYKITLEEQRKRAEMRLM